MKKSVLITVAAVLALAMLLTACGKKPETDTAPTLPDEQGGAMADSVFQENTPSAGTDTQPAAPTEDRQTTTAPTGEQTDPTKPTGGETKPTQPDKKPDPTTPGDSEQVDVDAVDYAQFQNMTGAEQQAFAEAFETPDAFFKWLNEKKAAYEKENPSIEIDGSGVIDMEDLLN